MEALFVTLFPVGFLIVLFGGGALLKRENVDIDGTPPINKALFLGSKYAIVLLWLAAVLHSWGIDLSWTRAAASVTRLALSLWVLGFALLFTGRFGMGRSFRIGAPRERTALAVDGLFKYSRNPMYVGVFITLLAAATYTMNPVVLAIGIFVVVVHHRIVLAEERLLRTAFGEPYENYCRRVSRYL